MANDEPSPPRVTVVIPTFNRAAFLPSAVHSALHQTLQEIEVVIVDDGSTDATPQVCTALAAGDSRVRLIREDNRGLAAARNAGLATAGADWVAFLDDDDLWVPEALATMLAAATPGLEALACLCNRFFSADSDLTPQEVLDEPGRFQVSPWPPVPPPAMMSLEALLLRPLAPINAAVFRRASLRELGGFDERFRAAEDYHLWLRLSARNPVPVVPAPLALVRSHRAQMSASLALQSHETRRVLEDFLADYPQAWAATGRRRLRRRLAALAREEAYAALLVHDKMGARHAAASGVVWNPFSPKGWFYLAVAPLPGLYARLRRLWRRVE